MTALSSKLFRLDHRACALAFGLTAFWVTGCSSASSGSPHNPSGDDIDSSTPADGSVPEDATVQTDDGGTGGDDASSVHHEGGGAEASAGDPSPAGDAGAARFCAAICAGLVACAADAGPCNCSAGSSALERTDFVDGFTSCVKGAIIADCADAGGAVQGCQVAAAAAISPTTAAANFCKNLEFTRCADILPNCLTNAGVYSDTTITAFSSCFPDLPDAAVDGGCVPFGNCLATAATP